MAALAHRDRRYIEAKIKFLEHRMFILRERISKDGGTQSLDDSLNAFREMLSDYKSLRG